MLFFGFLVFASGAITLKAWEYSKSGKRKRAGPFLVPITLLILVTLWSIAALSILTCPCYQPPHFRTNTLTGQCDYGQADCCTGEDPWYFKEGCSEEGKKAHFGSIEGYDETIESCREECEYEEIWGYCRRPFDLGKFKELKCKDIMECPNIECT